MIHAVSHTHRTVHMSMTWWSRYHPHMHQSVADKYLLQQTDDQRWRTSLKCFCVWAYISNGVVSRVSTVLYPLKYLHLQKVDACGEHNHRPRSKFSKKACTVTFPRRAYTNFTLIKMLLYFLSTWKKCSTNFHKTLTSTFPKEKCATEKKA